MFVYTALVKELHCATTNSLVYLGIASMHREVSIVVAFNLQYPNISYKSKVQKKEFAYC